MASLKSKSKKAKTTKKSPPSKKSRSSGGKSPIKTQSSDIKQITQNFQLLENKYYGACILDTKSSMLIYANNKLCRLLGYSKREMQKIHIKSVIHPDDYARVGRAVKNRIQNLPVQSGIRYKLLSKNGSELIAEVVTTPVSHNEKFYLYTIIRDVTSEVSIETELKESELRFKSFFELSPEPVITLDLDGKVTSINHAFEKLTGYTEKAILGKKFNNLPFWKRRGKAFNIGDCLQIRKKPLECKFASKNGKEKYLELYTNKIPLGNGSDEVLIIARDITGRKSTLSELRESEQKYKALASNITDGIGIIYKGRYVYANQKFAQIFGFKLGELVGKAIAKIVVPKEKNILRSLEKDIWKGRSYRKRLEFIGLKKDGYNIYLDLCASRITYHDNKALQITVTDITRRRIAEESLRQSEERFRNLVENVHYGFYITDIETYEILFLNKYARSLTKGYSRSSDEFNFFDLLSKEDQIYMGQMLQKRREGNTERIKGKLSVKLPNKKQIIVEYESSVITYRGRRCVQGIFKDITEFEKAREELVESEERLKSIFEGSRDAIFISDESAHFIDVNKAAEILTGYSREELLNMSIPELHDPQDLEPFYKFFNRILDGEEVTSSAYLRRKDKKKVLTEFSNKRVYISNKPFMHTAARDITEREKAAEELRQQQIFLDSVVENIPNMIFIKDAKDLKFEYINRAGEELLGYDREKFIGKADHDLFLTEQADFFIKKDREVLKSGKLLDIAEEPIYTPLGKKILHTKKIPIMDEAGKPQYLMGISEDITDQKEAERALIESEEQYRALVESSADGIAVVQGETIRFVNNRLVEMFGYDNKNEAEGHSFTKFVAPEFRELLLERGRKRDSGESVPYNYEFTGLRKNGTRIDAEISISLITYKGEPARQTLIRDITGRKWAERALRESEEKFRLISEQSMLGIYILQDNRIKFVNEAAAVITEVSVEEWSNWTVEDAITQVHPDDRAHVLEQARRKMQGRKDIDVHYSYRIITKSGKIRWLEQFSKPITYGGKTADLIALIDITDRVKMEQDLRHERDFSTGIISGTPAIIVGMSPNGITTFVNPAGEQITGYKAKELIGKNWWRIFYPGKESAQVKKLYEAFEKGAVRNYEMVLTSRSKEKRVIAWNSINRFDDNGNLVEIIGFGTDITEKKKADQALKNQRDMLREVTEDVIRVQEDERRRISMELHDSIGGSLSVVKLQIQNLIKSIQSDDVSLAEGLRAISELVSDTIAYLRQISANLRPVILDNLGLWATIEWFLNDFGEKSELDVDIDIREQDIKLNQNVENHLFRIIQQIMINIKTHSGAKKVVFKSWRKNSDIIFEISENGKGFDPDKIFDPSGRRHGMGMINIMERVNIVKGKLDIKSAPGRGTLYTVSIPVTD
jgi:PAS domain S-box-containing protein